MFSSMSHGTRTGWLALAIVVAAAPDAGAHLSMIRQGIEAHGSKEAHDFHGAVLAAGDFNGDGYEDLAMGAPWEDGGSSTEAGAVFYNFGSAHGITHVGAFSRDAADFGFSLQTGASFGSALAAADLDLDGFDDLVVGAPREDVDGKANAGRVYLLRGSSSGLSAWISFKQEHVGGSGAANAYFGYSFAVDDFDLDGYPDLAIGSPSTTGRSFVFVVHGDAGGPFGSTDLLTPDNLGFLHQDRDLFGASLAAGNVVGNSNHPDLIIGAPGRDNFTQTDAGTCFVVRGSDSGLQHSNAISFDSGIADAPQSNAQFGYSLATGRFSAGSYDWIAVGEPKAWVGGHERAGRVVVVHGRSDGLFPEMSQLLTQEGFGGVSEDMDEFGYSLAAGYFGDDPLFEDLYIGSPAEDVWGDADGGASLLFGDWGGPGSGGYMLYGQSWSGEFAERYDLFGYAAAFGAFDETGYDNLAVSAPGEDDVSGMVHVIAPWRQVPFLNCRQSIVMDCEDQIVFSQKPFDQVLIASTTKIMTVLIACERSQLPSWHPNHYPLDAVYTVPDWVADDVPGSQVPLVEGEQITLENLMYTCLFRSGNDAAHAIADLLCGSQGTAFSLPLFVEEMNVRAQQLGLANTSFNNPAGFENEAVGPDMSRGHHSTAFDMALLSRAAMDNELFSDISNTMSVSMTRNYPSGPEEYLCNNFFAWVLNNNTPRGSGIKGGFTPAAQTTGCFSARGFFNDAIATTFGTPENSTYGQDALNLLALATGSCISLQAVEEWIPRHLAVWEPIQAVANRRHDLGSMAMEPLNDLRFNLFHADPDQSSQTRARLEVLRISEVALATPPNDIESFGIEPFERHGDLRIVNMEDYEVQLLITFVGGGGEFFSIEPNGTIVIPAYEDPMPGASWTIINKTPGGSTAHLTVEESYGFLVDQAAGSSPVFTAVLERGDHAKNEGYDFRVEWLQDGQNYIMMIHDADMVVAAPEGDSALEESTVTVVPAATPNPFRESTRLTLALSKEALLGLSVYDVGGREVRRFEGARMTPGAWSIDWDGRDGSGSVVPPGVYFYKVVVDGEPVHGGKLVRIE